ncbi:thiamine phosphate synthase [Rubrobacter indicoceani]|uniref:thiamine phosphate synthase n=1 Tax=Rubrobacter indicoceani TaxID=2051957 RepID=UPI001F0979AD|nr:thiamine phosphate synthase [Rubrobacter indicoceani]
MVPSRTAPRSSPRKEARISNDHHIHLITDRNRASIGLREACRLALRGGVDVVQLREKGGPALAAYADALALLPEARKLGARVFLNDRLDVALAASADGAHLAGKSLPPEVARELLPPHMVLGVSVHGVEEARVAVEAGADYVTFGHVYPTLSKPGLTPRGVRQLAGVVAAVEVPVMAVGGIEARHVDEVLSTGAAGVAVISSIIAAEDPEAAARRLRDAVDLSPHPPKQAFAGVSRLPEKGGFHAADRKP